MGYPEKIHILVAAGASGGHLYPALSLIEALEEKTAMLEIGIVYPKKRIGNLVNRAGAQKFGISIIAFKFTPIKFLKAVFCFLKSLLETFFIIDKFRPDVVVGFGSYACLPLVLVSALFKKITIIHEQNVSLGAANRLCAVFADRLVTSFKETKAPSFVQKKSIFLGNPVRKSLSIIDKQEARHFFGFAGAFTVLVVGGSQGSGRLNLFFSQAVDLFKGREFQFIHICGKNDYQFLAQAYKDTGLKHCLFEYLDRIDYAYSAADLVICRAGAGTIAELAYFKKAGILIPLAIASNHQLENSRVLKSGGAAIVVEEKNLKALTIYNYIMELKGDSKRLSELEENIGKFHAPGCAERFADVVLSLSS